MDSFFHAAPTRMWGGETPPHPPPPMLISTQLALPAGRWSDTVTQIDALRDSSRLCWRSIVGTTHDSDSRCAGARTLPQALV